jgi:membrane protein YdbS with pleckstrin-like domain
MHLIPNSDTVPDSVNRCLLPQERQVIAVHLHPASLFGPSGVVIAGLAAAVVSSNLSKFSPDARLVIWLVWGLLLLHLIWLTLNWLVSYYVVTAYRMLLIKGVLARDVAMVPLARAADLRLRRTAMGRLLGYGQFILAPSGQDQALRNVKFLPYPEQIYLEVCGLIWPDRDSQPDLGESEEQESSDGPAERPSASS